MFCSNLTSRQLKSCDNLWPDSSLQDAESPVLSVPSGGHKLQEKLYRMTKDAIAEDRNEGKPRCLGRALPW